MAKKPPLITKRLLEGHLQVPPGTLDDDVSETAIRGASGAVRDECGWDLLYEEVVDQSIEGDESNVLFLPTAKLHSVEAVTVDGEPWLPYEPDLPAPAVWDFSVLTRACALKARGLRRWPSVEGAIRVSYTHGYHLWDEDESPGDELFNNLPEGLQRIVLAVAARSLPNPGGYATLKVGNISQTFAGTGLPTSFLLSSNERDDLAPYRVEG